MNFFIHIHDDLVSCHIDRPLLMAYIIGSHSVKKDSQGLLSLQFFLIKLMSKVSLNNDQGTHVDTHSENRLVP